MKSLQQEKKSSIPYKPIQTGVIDRKNSDSGMYQQHSADPLKDELINSYSFIEPASPHYAAQLEGKVIDEQYILNHIEKLKSMYDYVICEGAGGLYVPIDEEREVYFIDLIKQSKLPVLLVARTTLGTINHTLLSLDVLKGHDIPVLGIVLNGDQRTELERNNIGTIKNLSKLPTIVLPKVEHIGDISFEGSELFERLIEIE